MTSQDQHDSDQTPGEGLVVRALTPDLETRLREDVERALPTAGPDFGEAQRKLHAAVQRAAAIPMLGALTMYCTATKVGTNPEFDRPLGIHQFHIELVQAFALRSRSGSGLVNEPLFRVLEDVAEAVRRFESAWTLLEVRKIGDTPPGSARDLAQVLFALRTNAMAVRGWSYPTQMLEMLEALFSPLDAIVVPVLGLRPSALPRWWSAMTSAVGRRMNAHRDSVREAMAWPVDENWLRHTREQFGVLPVDDDEALVAQARTDDDTRRGFVMHSSDLRAHEIFRFDLADLTNLMPGIVSPASVRFVLDSWSLGPSGYDDVAPSRFLLENPVLGWPFVATESNVWHLFCAWILLHNPFELFERLIANHTELFDAYLGRRAEFLEQSVAKLLDRAFPGSEVERSLLYIDPADGKEYENDVLALVGSYALVTEAKAGRIGPEERRGKRRQLRDRISELLVKPSEQAFRFADLLAKSTGGITLRRKTDGGTVTIPCGQIHRVLTLGVTLEPLAGTLPRLHELSEAGLTERATDALAYSISLPDLDLVVRLLGHPSEILHYFRRRAEIERRGFLRGDEADLLGLYLQTGFNLGSAECDDQHRIDITGMSDPIDIWHYSEDADLEVARPTVRRTGWWEANLSRVESRSSQTSRWPEVGVTMCNVAYEDQDKFQGAMKTLHEEIIRGTRPTTDMVVFQNGPPQRRDVFVGLIAASPDREERKQQYSSAAQRAAHELREQRITVLAWTPRSVDEPCFAFAVFELQDVVGR